jgi:hypothetical protein
LDELNDEHDPIIAKMLTKAKEKLTKAAANEVAWEESHVRRQNESFE